MTSLLVRIDPSTVLPSDPTVLPVLQYVQRLLTIDSNLLQVSFTARQSDANVFDFTVQLPGRTWSSTLTFSGPGDLDPGVTYDVPDQWYTSEVTLIRLIRDALITARSQTGLATFSAEWLTNPTPAANTIQLIGTPSPVPVGTPVTLSWVAPLASQGSVTDWIDFVPVSAPNTTYINWIYVANATSGTHQFPTNGLTPGQYEFRYFLNNGYTRVATSVPVTIVS